jgi:hypothetical protein
VSTQVKPQPARDTTTTLPTPPSSPSHLVGHGEHGVLQRRGAEDLEALEEQWEVHREASALRLALVRLEERGGDRALRLLVLLEW